MSGHLTIENDEIDGLKIITRNPLKDDRGHLMRMFCEEELATAGWHGRIAQANHTLTKKKGTLRGMHFQRAPAAESKLVTCLKGEVFDVAVDLRVGSPTYLSWSGIILTQNNQISFLIPEGFAHGFQTLSDDVEMLYFHSSAFSPEFEGGLNALDPNLKISWPLPPGEQSKRDQLLPLSTSLKGLER
jgi:dTDP-4-dehydrorhamnose 3,5-epimerase